MWWQLHVCHLHVYLGPEAAARLAPPAQEEEELLDFTAAPREEGSRLACQLVIDESWSHIEVRVPASQ